jgi:hypothetical protein
VPAHYPIGVASGSARVSSPSLAGPAARREAGGLADRGPERWPQAPSGAGREPLFVVRRHARGVPWRLACGAPGDGPDALVAG